MNALFKPEIIREEEMKWKTCFTKCMFVQTTAMQNSNSVYPMRLQPPSMQHFDK